MLEGQGIWVVEEVDLGEYSSYFPDIVCSL
jgi:hypothetical protein